MNSSTITTLVNTICQNDAAKGLAKSKTILIGVAMLMLGSWLVCHAQMDAGITLILNGSAIIFLRKNVQNLGAKINTNDAKPAQQISSTEVVPDAQTSPEPKPECDKPTQDL